MNFKWISISMIVSAVLLSGCGNDTEEDKAVSESKKTEEAKNKAEEAKKKISDLNKKKSEAKEDNANEEVTEESSTGETTTESPSNEVPDQEQNYDISNVIDRETFKEIVYSNELSEEDKITAYNNAVQNGVLPQGNVMEGSALAAYESSLKVESGEEDSVYSSNPYPDNPLTKKYDHLYQPKNEEDNGVESE